MKLVISLYEQASIQQPVEGVSNLNAGKSGAVGRLQEPTDFHSAVDRFAVDQLQH